MAVLVQEPPSSRNSNSICSSLQLLMPGDPSKHTSQAGRRPDHRAPRPQSRAQSETIPCGCSFPQGSHQSWVKGAALAQLCFWWPHAEMYLDNRRPFEGCSSRSQESLSKSPLTPPPPQQAKCQIPRCGPCPDTLPEATRPVCRAWLALGSPLT